MIGIVDLIFCLTELMNFISMESSNVKPFSYVYASLANFLLLLPIILFEILVIKNYKLIHAKILYGLKLIAGNF